MTAPYESLPDLRFGLRFTDAAKPVATWGAWRCHRVAPVETPEVEEEPADDRPWVTIVWDDPVNLMSYVTWVFQKLFGYSRETARSS